MPQSTPAGYSKRCCNYPESRKASISPNRREFSTIAGRREIAQITYSVPRSLFVINIAKAGNCTSPAHCAQVVLDDLDSGSMKRGAPPNGVRAATDCAGGRCSGRLRAETQPRAQRQVSLGESTVCSMPDHSARGELGSRR